MAKSTVKGTKIKLDRSDIIIRTIGYVVVTLYALACVLPFLIIIGTSFTAEEVIRTEGAQLFPKQFTTKAYEMVIQGGAIWKSYGLTITMTLTGTLVGLGIISMTGYALQRKDFPFRNAISFYIYFTTLFSAGLAPYYLMMTQTYKLQDNYLAVWLPLLMSSWLIILMKNFVKSIPHEITESGKIDGAGDMKIFTALILPMLKPILATIALLSFRQGWNEYILPLVFTMTNDKLRPLTVGVNMLKNAGDGTAAWNIMFAGATISIVPILIVYCCFSRFFMGGLTAGAVKG